MRVYIFSYKDILLKYTKNIKRIYKEHKTVTKKWHAPLYPLNFYKNTMEKVKIVYHLVKRLQFLAKLRNSV